MFSFNLPKRKQVCGDLKVIYAAATESEAEFNLDLELSKLDHYHPNEKNLTST
ncbi:hypothetical protein [Pseudanabaena mucicola]|uniref:Uncharacterized protein n=1 Tax=Pseudanabaena mucicola FACHB-723 TaxID=2692860 RepID=A0ABR8A159_9CYAN|nr:hypothetical protein [Pseudanabaena mucicola]MBD2189966.1 hypothetical protein [Pseudanabaena mucicola FACHB-723]